MEYLLTHPAPPPGECDDLRVERVLCLAIDIYFVVVVALVAVAVTVVHHIVPLQLMHLLLYYLSLLPRTIVTRYTSYLVCRYVCTAVYMHATGLNSKWQVVRYTWHAYQGYVCTIRSNSSDTFVAVAMLALVLFPWATLVVGRHYTWEYCTIQWDTHVWLLMEMFCFLSEPIPVPSTEGVCVHF